MAIRSTLSIVMIGAILSASAAQETPEIVLRTVDGPRTPGHLLKIDKDWTVAVGGKEPRVVHGGDLISWKQVGLDHPPLCSPPYLRLTTGDVLPLAVPLAIELKDEALTVALAAPFGRSATIPHAALEEIALAPTTSSAANDRGDAVVLRNGDRIVGKLIGLDADAGVVMSLVDRKETLPLERVAAIAFDADFQARPRSRGAWGHLVLRNGARLMARSLESSDARGEGNRGDVVAVSLLGHRFAFPANQIAALRIRHGKAAYLDERKPIDVETTPFLDIARPVDFGVDPLGLGVHGRTRIRYPIEPGEAIFEATVRIAADAGPRGEAIVDVLLDGVPAHGAARSIRAADPPIELRIPLGSARTLTLVTDFGPRGNIGNHVTWTDARILRK